MIGRAAGWIGSHAGSGARRLGFGALVGGAVVAGGASAIMDKDGPWRGSIIPNVQSAAFGDPNAIQNMATGAIIAGVSRDPNETNNPTNFYYGEPVNPQGMVDRPGGPSGDLVFGMYNLRR